MAFLFASSPHDHNRKRTNEIMRTVILCCAFGIVAQCVFFGVGTLVQIAIASVTAVVAEAIAVACRRRPVWPYLRDNSALLTGVLIGIAIPPLAPWWIAVIGGIFAILIAKHVYGGLGQNLFNPAMVAYVVLLISFPVQMTTWQPPSSLMAEPVGMGDVFSVVFTGFDLEGFSANQLQLGIDGSTMATPLDTMKTALSSGFTASEALQNPIFGHLGGIGWVWINIGFFIGGLILIRLRIIQWHIPAGMLGSMFVLFSLSYLFGPDSSGSPLLHLFSGATMLGAFFIATDPVSASTTIRGRVIFGAMIGLLVFLIRSWGGYPDGVAFAVLLANMTVPLIDYYTRPRTYGH
ncbi:electron transport complex subunit RsxD [Thaumasiovibrio subtropicus]|uniref:electron transport complex subunit RsxD n=1 Tax=Thaumasiovibrio subtropicus TaxID=1891207 RepID=UPI000B35EC96|nr:electron transport complex subunit RsxD [Thaumasiovibrio subtropicus]